MRSDVIEAARAAPPTRRSVLPGRSVLSPARRRLMLTIAAIFVLWELAARLGLADERFSSSPTGIISAVPTLASDATVRSSLATTASAIGFAFLYGTTAGIVLGYLMGVRLLRDAFYGPLLFLLSVPKSIFIPLFMVFFGINTQTGIYFGAFSSFIYVIVNVVGGLDLVQDSHRRVGEAYGASLRFRLMDIVLPASLPGLFTGIWYGIKHSLQGVLIFELFISAGGVGQLVKLYTNQFRTDQVFALILTIAVASILLGTLWSALEKRLTRWRPAGA
jgi:ABC-type nitrate/sulfonate/bicarbonate transport system permease component